MIAAAPGTRPGPARPPESPVRVFFTGRNRAGSWDIRGAQIASTRSNWHADQEVEERDIGRFDLFCVVKRPAAPVVERIRRRGKAVVFDVLDSWAQPDDGLTTVSLALSRELFAARWKGLRFHSWIFPNRCMQEHLGCLVPHSAFIYHHFFPSISRSPLRRRPEAVGYEGNASYLGGWHEVMQEVCAARGLRFVVNPPSWEEVDVGFAARGGAHDSFLANHYKSNVKLANFYGSGTPCLVSAKERSYHETDQGDVRFFETPEQLSGQLEELLDLEVRGQVQARFLRAREAFRIELIASLYERYFLEVLRLVSAGRLR